MTTSFKKTDFIIILFTVAATLALVFALRVTAAGSEGAEGKIVRVLINGELVGSYALEEDRDIALDTARGHNLVRIRDGEVFMAEADCPDGYCVEQGRISGGARSIICLPHRVVVEVIGREEEVDVIAE